MNFEALMQELQMLNVNLQTLINQSAEQHKEVMANLEAICDYTSATAHGETLVVNNKGESNGPA